MGGKKNPPGGYDSTPMPAQIKEDTYTLKVTFHRASHLPVADLGAGASDPFVLAQINTDRRTRNGKLDPRVRFRSATAYRTRDPKWEAVWVVAGVPASGAEFKIRVYDEDDGTHDDQLGKIHLHTGRIGPDYTLDQETFSLSKRGADVAVWGVKELMKPFSSEARQDPSITISISNLGRTNPEVGKVYTANSFYWIHFSAILGHVTGVVGPNPDAGCTEDAEFQANELQLAGPAPNGLYHRYVEFQPFVKSMFQARNLRGKAMHALLHREHEKVYHFDPRTRYGKLRNGHERAQAFLDMALWGEGDRVFTYVITLDGMMRFTETGPEFSIDMLSKHTMHSDVDQWICVSGEFFVRKYRKGDPNGCVLKGVTSGEDAKGIKPAVEKEIKSMRINTQYDGGSSWGGDGVEGDKRGPIEIRGKDNSANNQKHGPRALGGVGLGGTGSRSHSHHSHPSLRDRRDHRRNDHDDEGYYTAQEDDAAHDHVRGVHPPNRNGDVYVGRDAPRDQHTPNRNGDVYIQSNGGGQRGQAAQPRSPQTQTNYSQRGYDQAPRGQPQQSQRDYNQRGYAQSPQTRRDYDQRDYRQPQRSQRDYDQRDYRQPQSSQRDYNQRDYAQSPQSRSAQPQRGHDQRDQRGYPSSPVTQRDYAQRDNGPSRQAQPQLSQRDYDQRDYNQRGNDQRDQRGYDQRDQRDYNQRDQRDYTQRDQRDQRGYDQRANAQSPQVQSTYAQAPQQTSRDQRDFSPRDTVQSNYNQAPQAQAPYVQRDNNQAAQAQAPYTQRDNNQRDFAPTSNDQSRYAQAPEPQWNHPEPSQAQSAYPLAPLAAMLPPTPQTEAVPVQSNNGPTAQAQAPTQQEQAPTPQTQAAPPQAQAPQTEAAPQAETAPLQSNYASSQAEAPQQAASTQESYRPDHSPIVPAAKEFPDPPQSLPSQPGTAQATPAHSIYAKPTRPSPNAYPSQGPPSSGDTKALEPYGGTPRDGAGLAGRKGYIATRSVETELATGQRIVEVTRIEHIRSPDGGDPREHREYTRVEHPAPARITTGHIEELEDSPVKSRAEASVAGDARPSADDEPNGTLAVTNGVPSDVDFDEPKWKSAEAQARINQPPSPQSVHGSMHDSMYAAPAPEPPTTREMVEKANADAEARKAEAGLHDAHVDVNGKPQSHFREDGEVLLAEERERKRNPLLAKLDKTRARHQRDAPAKVDLTPAKGLSSAEVSPVKAKASVSPKAPVSPTTAATPKRAPEPAGVLDLTDSSDTDSDAGAPQRKTSRSYAHLAPNGERTSEVPRGEREVTPLSTAALAAHNSINARKTPTQADIRQSLLPPAPPPKKKPPLDPSTARAQHAAAQYASAKFTRGAPLHVNRGVANTRTRALTANGARVADEPPAWQQKLAHYVEIDPHPNDTVGVLAGPAPAVELSESDTDDEFPEGEYLVYANERAGRPVEADPYGEKARRRAEEEKAAQIEAEKQRKVDEKLEKKREKEARKEEKRERKEEAKEEKEARKKREREQKEKEKYAREMQKEKERREKEEQRKEENERKELEKEQKRAEKEAADREAAAKREEERIQKEQDKAIRDAEAAAKKEEEDKRKEEERLQKEEEKLQKQEEKEAKEREAAAKKEEERIQKEQDKAIAEQHAAADKEAKEQAKAQAEEEKAAQAEKEAAAKREQEAALAASKAKEPKPKAPAPVAEPPSTKAAVAGATTAADTSPKRQKQGERTQSGRVVKEKHVHPVETNWLLGPSDGGSTDPSDYQLIIDNDSGTYRPDKNLMPLLQAWLTQEFTGLHVMVMSSDDDRLQTMKKKRQEKKKERNKGRVWGYGDGDGSSISSSDEEDLKEGRAPIGKTEKGFDFLEHPKKEIKAQLHHHHKK